MTIIFSTLEDTLDCTTALGNARRPYSVHRNAAGEYEITTAD